MAKLLNCYIVILVIIFSLSVNANVASSYDFTDDSGLIDAGLEAGYEATSDFNYDLPYGIGKMIGTVLAFIGVLFLILMIYGGYIWMMARGNEQETEKAKSIIQNALIGIVVVLTAYAITYLVSLDIFTVT